MPSPPPNPLTVSPRVLIPGELGTVVVTGAPPGGLVHLGCPAGPPPNGLCCHQMYEHLVSTAQLLKAATVGDRFWYLFTTPPFDDAVMVLQDCAEDPEGANFRTCSAPVAGRGHPAAGGVLECAPSGRFVFYGSRVHHSLIPCVARWVREHHTEHPGLLALVGAIQHEDPADHEALWQRQHRGDASIAESAVARAVAASLRSMAPGHSRSFALLAGDDLAVTWLMVQGPAQSEAGFRQAWSRMLGARAGSPWIAGRVVRDPDAGAQWVVAAGTPNFRKRLALWVDRHLPRHRALRRLRSAHIHVRADDGTDRVGALFPGD